MTCSRIRFLLIPVACLCTLGIARADDPSTIELDEATRARCLGVLREGMRGTDFWPAIHAAEGLTLGGYGAEVVADLSPRLASEVDDQRRCGIARELVRAGEKARAAEMLAILAGDDPHGHVHAAESLYKVGEIGDGEALRRAFAQTADLRLHAMAAAALGRCGNPSAMASLRGMLGHDDPELFKLAAWVLGRIGDASDIERIRAELPRCQEELTRAYLQHSLAALGDPAGREALLGNLHSEDSAVRTYAATFVGDARAVAAAPTLTQMLDDPHLDARYRAAQSLLVLATPPPGNPQEDISVLVYPVTAEHPRYTEGSVLALNDGGLLFAITEFSGSNSDFATAHIVACTSHDGGRTWSAPRILQENTGAMNVMSVTLRRLDPETVGLFYLQKNSPSELDLYVKFSTDEGHTFGSPVQVTTNDGYHVVNNDRVTQLGSGRLLAPAASTPDVHAVNHFTSRCYLSDDQGRSWRPGRGAVDADRRGAMEPEVIELRDGRVMMLVRTQMGIIGKSYSDDGGDTWSALESLGPQAPEAPATVRRIPSTGDLLLIWNNTYTPDAGHGGKRTPLTAALSADEGATWQIVANLESDPRRTYSYTSLTFVGPRAVMSYWESGIDNGDLSCRFRSLPVGWFYRTDHSR